MQIDLRTVSITPLRQTYNHIAERLGAYPHPAIRPGQGKSKAGGGWIRLVSPDCEDYKVVVSPKAVEEHGLPKDPWGNEMVPANSAARAALGH